MTNIPSLEDNNKDDQFKISFNDAVSELAKLNKACLLYTSDAADE